MSTAMRPEAEMIAFLDGSRKPVWLSLVLGVFVFSQVPFALAQPPEQNAIQPVPPPRVLLDREGDDVILLRELVPADPDFAKEQAQTKSKLWLAMRGLIQNELSAVDALCELDSSQKQALVDIAEREWQSRSNDSITKSMQQQMYGLVDLDTLAERLTKSWLASLGRPEQISAYDQELASRMQIRKQALISKMLDSLSSRLQLTAAQMQKIEEVLAREWRDRWFRSIEATFINVALHPEIRPRWTVDILTSAQRSALALRENHSMFSAVQVMDDSPALGLSTRFSLGTIISSDAIELSSHREKADPTGRNRIREALQLANPVEDLLNAPK